MHPFSITLWRFVYICVNFYFQKFWLIHICYHIIGNMTCGFLASQLFISYQAGGLIFFVSNQVFQFFAKILSFSFFLVTSECDVYLPVDPSLVYSYPKMLLLFFSLILAWFKTIFLDSYLGVFCSWVQLASVEFKFCHLLSPACKSCFSILIHFDFKINANPYQSDNYMALLVCQYKIPTLQADIAL